MKRKQKRVKTIAVSAIVKLCGYKTTVVFPAQKSRVGKFQFGLTCGLWALAPCMEEMMKEYGLSRGAFSIVRETYYSTDDKCYASGWKSDYARFDWTFPLQW